MLSSARTQAKFAREIDAMKDHGGPALGVCFGHQLLGHAFGSRVVRAANSAKGYRDAEVLRHDPLFRGLPHSIAFTSLITRRSSHSPRGSLTSPEARQQRSVR